MTYLEWFIFFLIIQIIHFIGTWKLYIKAGRKAWEAIIPVYNAIVLMQIINRPKWWVILLFLPVINQIMFIVVWVETIRSFGKNRIIDTCLVVLSLGLYIGYLNYSSDKLEYIRDRSLKPRTAAGEWVNSILFAIVAATLVHTYFVQPYVIPTGSLEKTLLIGDFLFVSKAHYGPRTPMTTISAPMVHDTVPLIGVKSYLFDDNFFRKEVSFRNKFQLPYLRIPGFYKIKRNEIVVFNQPADTLLDMNNLRPKRNYYKPIDKKTNLVKRCVGVPGDSLEIRDGYIYINGSRTKLPGRAKPQYNFFVDTQGKTIRQTVLTNRYRVRDGLKYSNGRYALNRKGGYVLTMTDKEAEQIAKNPVVVGVTKILQAKGVDGDVFPHLPSLGWNEDNYGPIYIPQEGKTVELNKFSLPFYKRIIQEYEGNELSVRGDEIRINGEVTNSYTFKQDYYWMMGDNRQNSLDARAWGYVPFDHVVGKPVFIWFSWDSSARDLSKRIRWNRLFTTVHGDDKPRSYFVYFLAVLIGYLEYSQYRKRKK